MNWAPIDEVKAGTRLICDGGFDCLDDGQVCEVCADERGELYVVCRGPDGKGEPRSQRHGLDGQLDEEAKHYVGFRMAGEVPA